MPAAISTGSFSSIVHFVTAANASSFTEAALQLGKVRISGEILLG